MKSELLYQKLCRFTGTDNKYLSYHKHEAMVFSTLVADQVLDFYSGQIGANTYALDMLRELRLPYDNVAVEFKLSSKYDDAPARVIVFVSSITLDPPEDAADNSHPTAITIEVFAERPEIEASNVFALGLGRLKYIYPVDDAYNDSICAYLDNQYGIQNVLTVPGKGNGKDFSLFMVPSSISCSVTADKGMHVKETSMRKSIEAKQIDIEVEVEAGSTYGWAALCLLDFLNRNRSGLKKHVVTPKLTVKDKMNRGKRRGARRYTHVYLDKVEYIKNDVPVMRTDMQAHMVRGHFKRKKNGIFWWNPFVRGRGKLNKREAYIVKESPDERSPVVVQ